MSKTVKEKRKSKRITQRLTALSLDVPSSTPAPEFYRHVKPRQPQFEIMELTGATIQFKLTRSDHAVANMLRTIFLSRVTSFAIEKLLVNVNTSTMNSQFMKLD